MSRRSPRQDIDERALDADHRGIRRGNARGVPASAAYHEKVERPGGSTSTPAGRGDEAGRHVEPELLS